MMQANPHLSIVIPTCNRAGLLDYCLEVHIPLARAHNVQLFISDNASTDATAEVVQKRIKEYPLIQYHRNETNVGADENFEIALNYPNTQYVWLLGDSYQIPSDGIDYLLNLIADSKQKYDVIVFNLADQKNDICTQDFTDSNSLLCSLGALMTCLSCLVHNKGLINGSDFVRYRNSYFMQTGIIFDAIARQPFSIHWAQSISVQGLDHYSLKKNSWSMTSNVFEIACKKWVNFVFSLPVSYDLDNKLECLIDFTKVSGIFSFRHLLLIRAQNILNYKNYKQYSYLFPFTIKYSKFTILIIALLPCCIPRTLKIIKDAIK
jgi:glycosyltransferase involved in cell wall biosynthesis